MQAVDELVTTSEGWVVVYHVVDPGVKRLRFAVFIVGRRESFRDEVGYMLF